MYSYKLIFTLTQIIKFRIIFHLFHCRVIKRKLRFNIFIINGEYGIFVSFFLMTSAAMWIE